jgi:hypothetical protein
MKMIAVLLSVCLSSVAFAETNNTTISLEQTPHTNTMNNAAAELTLTPDTPNWNISIAKSQFESDNATNTAGLTIDIQRRFMQNFFVGASYTNFKVKQSEYAYYNNNDVVAGSLEAHPIRVELINDSEFFAAVNGGIMAANDMYGWNSSPFYGAGIGVNYNNQVGVRADMKTSRTFNSFSSIAIIGYY